MTKSAMDLLHACDETWSQAVPSNPKALQHRRCPAACARTSQETAVIRDVRLRSVLLVAALKRVTHVPAFSLALPRLLMGYAH